MPRGTYHRLNEVTVCGGLGFGVVSVADDGAAGMPPIRSFSKRAPLAKAASVSTSVNKPAEEGKRLIFGAFFCFGGGRGEGEATMREPCAVTKGSREEVVETCHDRHFPRARGKLSPAILGEHQRRNAAGGRGRPAPQNAGGRPTWQRAGDPEKSRGSERGLRWLGSVLGDLGSRPPASQGRWWRAVSCGRRERWGGRGV